MNSSAIPYDTEGEVLNNIKNNVYKALPTPYNLISSGSSA
jgi:hypothetical protein